MENQIALFKERLNEAYIVLQKLTVQATIQNTNALFTALNDIHFVYKGLDEIKGADDGRISEV